MANLNNQKNRTAILDRIEKDGVRLKDFEESQKKQIIKMYASVCFREGLI